MLEWFERRGVPSRIAAAICVIFFLLLLALREDELSPADAKRVSITHS